MEEQKNKFSMFINLKLSKDTEFVLLTEMILLNLVIICYFCLSFGYGNSLNEMPEFPFRLNFCVA